jgi:two-component system nitrate/nitrite sensor histidine kinase NarX
MRVPANGIFSSLVFQLLLSMVLIAGLALASMGLSIYVTLNAGDDAAAINQAGSLRMQSYRIGDLLSRGASAGALETLAQEAEAFSRKLFQSTFAVSVAQSGNAPLKKSYERIAARWRETVEPLLASAQRADVPWEAVDDSYHVQLQEQITAIEHLVTQLQRDSEGKIELLGMTEGVTVLLVIFTVLFLAMKADTNFVEPLRGLVRAAERVDRGDLGHRLEYSGNNELGLLSQTFNEMLERLEAQYRTLEEQVRERTDELRRSNQALYFLYKTSREIASSPYDRQLLNVFLAELKRVAHAEAISLCFNPEPNSSEYEMINGDLSESAGCVGECFKCALAFGKAGSNRPPGTYLPIRNCDGLFGFLHVSTREGVGLEPWQNQLLNTVAETLATAFAFHRTLGQERRLLLLEERSAIARELHDSLAQSLSYMKLETARLRKMTGRGFEPARIADAIGNLQEGLDAAYRHLRDLLVTFRAKLDAPDLRSALEQLVTEVDGQTRASVRLEYALGSCAFRPNADVHIAHILREAMNNAARHSRAGTITLRCSRDQRGGALFCVEDDGIGMPRASGKTHRYGLQTMRERADRLEGSLAFIQRESGGTRVELRVTPRPQLLRA